MKRYSRDPYAPGGFRSPLADSIATLPHGLMLRRIRRWLRLTKRQFAEHAQLHPSYITKIERTNFIPAAKACERIRVTLILAGVDEAAATAWVAATGHLPKAWRKSDVEDALNLDMDRTFHAAHEALRSVPRDEQRRIARILTAAIALKTGAA